MAELYTIEAQTLTDAADSIRRYINASKGYTLSPSVDGGNGVIVQGSVTIHYREYIDAPDTSYDGMNAADGTDVVIAYDYLPHKINGIIVPVLYKTSIGGEYDDIPDTEQPMYYEGTAVVDGVAYNKWRLIDGNEFLWDGTAKKYIYTNVIVSVKGTIIPTEFPSKIDEVYNAGYGTGYGSGYDDGYDAGKVSSGGASYESGYNTGYGTGYDKGYNKGYGEGYDNGYREGEKSAVDSPLPIPTETEAEMTALLTNATSESVGAVYKYTGNTTDTYEHGALYIIAEE